MAAQRASASLDPIMTAQARGRPNNSAPLCLCGESCLVVQLLRRFPRLILVEPPERERRAAHPLVMLRLEVAVERQDRAPVGDARQGHRLVQRAGGVSRVATILERPEGGG